MKIQLIAGRVTALFILLLLWSCQKEVIELPGEEPLFDVEIGTSAIPYLVIDTRGVGILNEPKIPADMTIYAGKEEVQSTPVGIEYRGSTSFRISDKKSFGIETWDDAGNDVNVAFFDFPAEEDFVLMGHIVNLDDRYIFDRTLMYHHLGYQLYRKMGNYGSRSRFVEVEINGTYQGVYVFMEKLKRDKNRIDVKKLDGGDTHPDSITGGYILKIDKTAGGDIQIDQPLEYFEHNWEDDARYTSAISFRSQYDIDGNLLTIEPFGPPYHAEQYLETYFLYEYPKAEDITEAQKRYIQNYMHEFETALLTDDFNSETRTYTNYADIPSFVDYFILNELCRNVDGYRLSTYMYKDRDEKLKMGPVWDLNIGYDSGDRVPLDGWVINYNDYVERDAWMMPFWWPRLIEDPLFTSAVKMRWEELRIGVLSTTALLNLVDENADYLIDNNAISRNYNVWDGGMGVDYYESISRLKSYLENRATWMDGMISSF